MALPGELVSSSCHRFTTFIRSVPNLYIKDESLKEYFYRDKDENSKAILDTSLGGSYGECTFQQIAEKVEKISWNLLHIFLGHIKPSHYLMHHILNM